MLGGCRHAGARAGLGAQQPNRRHGSRSTLRYGSLGLRHFAWLLLPLLVALAASAQPTNPPHPQDPLMSLMISQPKIDISAPVAPTAAFDPPTTAPGQPTIYRVTFNALEETIDMPDKLATPAGLALSKGAHGEVLRVGQGSFLPLTAFNYRVRPAAAGTFTMPEFTATVDGKPVRVPSARLEVVPAAPAQPAQRILLELAATNVFAGQAVRAKVVLPGSFGGAVQGLAQVQLTGQGFLVDLGAAHQRIEMLPFESGRLPSYVYETTLTPLMAGKLSVFAQGFVAGNRFTGTITISGTAIIPGGMPQYTLVETEPVELHVRPLPTEGELPGFTGGIGNFTLGPPSLRTNVLRAGDVLTLSVTVTNRGDGPLARLVAPPAPHAPDWQVFPPEEVAPPQGVVAGPERMAGVTTFNYTLIPLTEQARATPAIPFSYFDPERECYADLTIPAVPVTVKPGVVPGDLQALVQAATPSAPAEKEPVLRGLAASPGRTAATLVPSQQQAWFPLAQLAPAALFAGLWAWDRRRRFYEQHPEVLLRRRARRALRRQRRVLRQAARAKDAPGFAAAAVSAMQVACAPHYPAQPRALVGKDVLALVQDSGGNGRAGEVVRRLFGVNDATRFAVNGGDATELLALEPEIEGVLQRLEERLVGQ